VIGSHPHVVQPIKKESATAPDGTRREALVVYSMGNFISNQQQANTDIGIMVQVDIVKNKGVSKAKVGNYGYIPVWRYIHKSTTGKTTYFTLPVSRVERDAELLPGMPAASRAAMLRAAEGVRKRLSGSPEIRY
jgi:poly-gamma-glutamate synthesis protein (capsule biosynthesis protein)